MIRNLLLGGMAQVSKNCTRHASVTKSTIDSNEVEHFTKFSEFWWAKDSPTKMLRQMNALRVPYIQDALVTDGVITKEATSTEKPLSGVKILDAGCGGGFLSEALALLGAKTTGLDATRDLVEAAKIHRNLNKELANTLDYYHTSIEDFARTNEAAFDAVVSSEVIEHVVAKKEFLEGFVKCVKPGGTVIMTTISQTWRAYIEAIFMWERVYKLVPKGTHEYGKLIRPEDLGRLLEECGCTIKDVRGFSLRPLKLEWNWSKHSSVTYAIHAVKNK